LPDGHWDPADPETDGRYFLQIADGKALGFAGCDEYEATVEQDGDDLDFADFTKTTRKNCDPDVVPDPLEGNLPAAIEAITSVEMDGDLLVLRGDDTTLSFRERAAS
jgi:heat shock protein HslJ